jgi:hypothetical protein
MMFLILMTAGIVFGVKAYAAYRRRDHTGRDIIIAALINSRRRR